MIADNHMTHGQYPFSSHPSIASGNHEESENIPSRIIWWSRCLKAQHLLDLIAGAADTNWIFVNRCCQHPCFWQSFTASQRCHLWWKAYCSTEEGSSICPIAIGYTLRCLTVKFANSHIIERQSNKPRLVKVSVGVSVEPRQWSIPSEEWLKTYPTTMCWYNSTSLMHLTLSGMIPF